MNTTKNILYLSYDGMTDPLGQSQVLPYIIGLTKAGYKFTLISFEKEERYQKNKHTISAICKSHKIDWQPLMYTKRPPVLSTLWDIYKLNKKAKKLHKQKQFQLLHCRSYITALIGLGFKKKHQVKFLFDMRGFWADERVDGKIWNINKLPFKQIFSYFKKKEIQFFNESDGIISLTHEGKKEILTWEKVKIHPEKITVIPTCVDLELFDFKKVKSKDTLQLKEQLGFEKTDFILTYLGSLGTWYLVDEMLDFFKVLFTQNKSSKFVIYTADNFDIILDKLASKGIKKESIFLKTLARPEVPLYLSIADLSISFIKPSYSKKASSPTKMGEIFGMGIPMVCNGNVGDVAQIITNYDCGVIVTDFSEIAYQKALINLKITFEKSPHHFYSASEKTFSLEKGNASFVQKYDSILD